VKAVPERETSSDDAELNEPHPYRVRLPEFASEASLGLGDVVKRVTRTFGIQPCGGCERRAAALNRWFGFNRRAR
jgi:hypothetical protein